MFRFPALPESHRKYLLLLMICICFPAQGNMSCIELLQSTNSQADLGKAIQKSIAEKDHATGSVLPSETRFLTASRYANSKHRWLQKVFDRMAKIFPKWTAGVKSGLERKAVLALFPLAKEFLLDPFIGSNSGKFQDNGLIQTQGNWAPDLILAKDSNSSPQLQLRAKKDQVLSEFQAEQILGLAEFITNFLLQNYTGNSDLNGSRVTPLKENSSENGGLLIAVLQDLLNMKQQVFEAVNGGARGLLKAEDMRLSNGPSGEFHLMPRLNRIIRWYEHESGSTDKDIVGYGNINFGLNSRLTQNESEIRITISKSSVTLEITRNAHLLTGAKHGGSGYSIAYSSFLRQIEGAYLVESSFGSWSSSSENRAVYKQTPSNLKVRITASNALLASGRSFQDVALRAIESLLTEIP